MRWECRERFPRHRLERKPLGNDPGMHHGTCVTHVPWRMSESLTRGDGENVPGIPGACATHNFIYLVRGRLGCQMPFLFVMIYLPLIGCCLRYKSFYCVHNISLNPTAATTFTRLIGGQVIGLLGFWLSMQAIVSFFIIVKNIRFLTIAFHYLAMFADSKYLHMANEPLQHTIVKK